MRAGQRLRPVLQDRGMATACTTMSPEAPTDPEEPEQTTGCPECGADRVVDDGGDRYCPECGLVLEDAPIDPGPEWRAFSSEEKEKRARTGAPVTVLLHDKGLSTKMGWPGRDANGQRISNADQATLRRLRMWNRRSRTSSGGERNMARALSDIQRTASRIGLPKSVRETASVLYREAMERDLIQGRTIEDVAGASLYAACRKCDVPRSLDEIAEAAGVSKTTMARAYRALARELELGLAPTRPQDHVARFASELDLGPAARRRAEEILEAAGNKGVTAGKNPLGVAAAALYVAAQDDESPPTQREVSEVSRVSEVTIRNRASDLRDAVAS